MLNKSGDLGESEFGLEVGQVDMEVVLMAGLLNVFGEGDYRTALAEMMCADNAPSCAVDLNDEGDVRLVGFVPPEIRGRSPKSAAEINVDLEVCGIRYRVGQESGDSFEKLDVAYAMSLMGGTREKIRTALNEVLGTHTFSGVSGWHAAGSVAPGEVDRRAWISPFDEQEG